MYIRHLPSTLISKIAAGEVLERPAAALKELAENALDAGASSLQIWLRGGGIEEMVVQDNGSGMGPEDLLACVDRHATSKLPDEDLLQLAFFGFRGEALATIGACAKLEIVSKRSEDAHASRIVVENGVKSGLQAAGGLKGTRVMVRDLFFSTPARLKFLKSARAEGELAQDVIKKMALVHPAVAFELWMDGILQWRVVPQSVMDRWKALTAVEVHSVMMPVQYTQERVCIEGWISRPLMSRSSSVDHHVFVNKRPVKDLVLRQAVRQAFQDLLPSGRHPLGVLLVSVDPQWVDVNVHPAKSEVRFRDPQMVRAAVVKALTHALQEPCQRLPALSVALPAPVVMPASVVFHRLQDRRPVSVLRQWAQHTQPPLTRTQSPLLGNAMFQLFDAFIVAQHDTGLVLVDQHAAHERITYERLKAHVAQGALPSRALPFVEEIALEGYRREALLEHQDVLLRYGFRFEVAEPGLRILGVPAMFENLALDDLFQDMAANVAEGEALGVLEGKLQALLARAACHGSIRAGKVLSLEEMQTLLRQMEQTPHFEVCPHGRPTWIALDRSQFDRLFGRS